MDECRMERRTDGRISQFPPSPAPGVGALSKVLYREAPLRGPNPCLNCDSSAMVTYLFHLYSRSSHNFILFHSFHGLMNSINWPAPSVGVFTAQLVEHCSATAEATVSNPAEIYRATSQLLKLRSREDDL